MSSLSVSSSEYEVIEKHLDIKLITPVLEHLGLLLPTDIDKLGGKSQKQAVKLILKKARQDSASLKLFCDSLEQTKTCEGHQKILEVLSTKIKATDQNERNASNDGSCHKASNTAATSSTVSVQPPEISSSSSNSIFSNKIKVHFIYDELEFPAKIKADDFKEFYAKVISTLLNKKSGSKPCNLKYQFGAKCYDFNKDTELDDLCMDEDNPEITIVATSSQMDSASSDPDKSKVDSTVSMSNSDEISAESAPLAQTGQNCALTVEDDKDLEEKHFLKSLIDSALGYLQRSLAMMIKSVMSRLFGTKEILQKLYDINLELNKLPDDSPKKTGMTAIFNKMIDKSCKFWKSDCVETNGLSPERWIWHNWVWHSRQMLPRKKDPQEEWRELSEDLMSWKLDICLKLIKRATHDKKDLFTSEFLCFKTSQTEYNIKGLADNTTEIRNFYAHPPSCKKVNERYAQDFLAVEEFANELVRWFKNENDNTEDVHKCLGDLHQIQKKQKEYLNYHMVEWEKVLNALKNLNFNEFGYILVSTPCNSKVGVAVSKEILAKLSNIPWDSIVDFDVNSREDGLLHSLCELKGDQYRMKVPCQLFAKNIVVPFSYADIDGAERKELCRDGRIPWIFPHGEVHNKTNEACHFKNYDKYYRQIQQPLITAMRKITTDIRQNKSQGVVSLILCYGSYACESQKLPYKNYFSDLKHLCEDLKHSGSHVVVLSDNSYMEEILKPFPVLKFPLEVFCKMIQEKPHVAQDNSLLVNMPSLIGKERLLRSITFDEEDFELIHEHIAEHEILKLLTQKKIDLQQQNQILADDALKNDIKYNLRENFYRGDRVTWVSLNKDHTITRREEDNIIIRIREKLQEHVYSKLETIKYATKYVIYHSKGAGATTLARKILWNLRKEFPCVILKSNYKHSEAKAKCTSSALKALYDDLQYPILMLVDEEPSFRTIQHLTDYLQELRTPVVFLQIQRFYSSTLVHQEVRDTKDSFVLPSTLQRDDADNLKDEFFVTLGKDKISAAKHRLAKLESSLATPAKGDQITDVDGAYSGTITEVSNKKEGAYYLVSVIWHNNFVETCRIGSFASKSDRKYKEVYLKKEITKKLYETFHFYGIMYLDEDFRESMSEHVQKCLDSMIPDWGMDDLLKQKFLILANLSVLFAFKVCESIHIKAFEHLCYAVTRSSRFPDKFNIERFIPEAALEFTITTLKGRFCIIHPIVAEEIIKFYCSISHIENPSPDFYCHFLNHMLLESEYPNEEALSAVNRLLKYRECIDDGHGYFIRKPFSELVIKLDKQNPMHAIEVLEYASDKIHLQTCHTYGHFARYVSKSIKDFERALSILEQARRLATKNSERGLVLNIKGDIYREWLENYLEQHKTAGWEEIRSRACDLHFRSCQAYQDAYRTNHEDIPLFNELTVRINLLEAIKKRHKVSKQYQKLLNVIHEMPDQEVAGSVDSCRQLVKDLSEMINEGQSFDKCRDEAHLKTLESRLLEVVGASEKEQKHTLCFLMKRPMYVNILHIRRNYIHLCHLDSNPSPTDFDFCLDLLEEIFKSAGHVDRDMKNWLLIIKNVPTVGGNLKVVEEKLLLWKNQGPCISDDKKKIQVKNNPLWVNFYLTICYFIKLIETDKEDEIPPIVEKFNNTCKVMQEEGKENKSRFRIKEWLHQSGIGFGRLRSGQYISVEMLQLTGSVGIPSWQEARQSRGDKGFPYILWKSIRIPFDAKKYSDHHLKQGNQVTFGVGFTFRGPQAIPFIKSNSSGPTSPSKVTSENEGQQSAQISIPPTLSYSQAASNSKAPTMPPAQQQPTKKKGTRKKKKYS